MAKSNGERHAFQAEVSKLLGLMANSLYRDKEIFLRELISNASDACDKLRYAAITKPELLGDDAALAVTIKADSKDGVLVVADNGIGMNREELIDNLGTIARSGTEAFVKQMAESQGSGGEDEADGQNEQDSLAAGLIGQFGVGFYSSFMVAKRVEVVTRRADEAEGWRWRSDGTGSFSIAPEADAARGTRIELLPAQGRPRVPGAAAHPHRRQGVLRPHRPADLAGERERPEGDGQRGLGALEPAEERHRRSPVPRVLPPHRPHAGRSLAHHPPPCRRADRIHGAALRAGLQALRPVRPDSPAPGAALRQAGLHHRRVRGPDPALPPLHAWRGGLQRPRAQREPRDPSARPHPGEDPHRLGEARLLRAREARQEDAGRVCVVLGELRGGTEGRTLRRRGAEGPAASPRPLPHHGRRRSLAFARRLRGRHAGAAGGDLLHQRGGPGGATPQPPGRGLPGARDRRAAHGRPGRPVLATRRWRLQGKDVPLRDPGCGGPRDVRRERRGQAG